MGYEEKCVAKDIREKLKTSIEEEVMDMDVFKMINLTIEDHDQVNFYSISIIMLQIDLFIH